MSRMPFAHLVHQPLGQAHMRAQRKLRCRAAHPEQPVEHERAPQAELRAHRDHRAQARRHRHLVLGALPDLDEKRRVAQELLAGGRERGAGLVAHEKLAAELRLEGLHAHADRGLRDVQALGGAHEVSAVDDLEEGARERDVHAS